MKCGEHTNLDWKLGMWGTQDLPAKKRFRPSGLLLHLKQRCASLTDVHRLMS
jgi:hypothetical protein